MRLYTPSGIGYALRPPTGLPQARRRIYRGVGRLGYLGQTELTRNCFTSSGAAGTEVVDPSGNVIYTCDQVAADPSLANVGSGGCPSGMSPVFYPGGQSECAANGGGSAECEDPTGVCGNYIISGPTANYVNGWNLTAGGSFNDPSAWVWYPVGTAPTTPNPAIAYNAAPLPTAYQTPGDCYDANGNSVQCGTTGAIVAGTPSPTPVLQGPAPTPNLTPPATGTSNPVAGSTAGSSTTGITPGTTVNGQPTGNVAATAVCSGLGIGPCIGPLDAGTWGLIAAAGVVLLLMMEKK
jgi:hypothetical protein